MSVNTDLKKDMWVCVFGVLSGKWFGIISVRLMESSEGIVDLVSSEWPAAINHQRAGLAHPEPAKFLPRLPVCEAAAPSYHPFFARGQPLPKPNKPAAANGSKVVCRVFHSFVLAVGRVHAVSAVANVSRPFFPLPCSAIIGFPLGDSRTKKEPKPSMS